MNGRDVRDGHGVGDGQDDDAPGGSLLAIAHRAGNSLPGLRRAVASGADVIEADVHGYRGRLEVRHLKTMGPLPLLWDAWELRSAWAPRLRLEQVLDAAAPGVTLMLDLKGSDPGVGEAVARCLDEIAPGRPVLVCSRHWPALRPFEHRAWVRTVRSARTSAELGLLLTHLQRSSSGPAGNREYGVSVHRSMLTGETVAALHERVEVVMTWPVNDTSALASVSAYRRTGTIGVISDEPAILDHLVSSRH